MQFRVNTLVSAWNISLTYHISWVHSSQFTVPNMSYFIVSQVTACSPQFNVNNWMQRAEEKHPTEEVSHCHSKYQNKGEPSSRKRSYTMTLQVSKLYENHPETKPIRPTTTICSAISLHCCNNWPTKHRDSITVLTPQARGFLLVPLRRFMNT